jgi:uncharacterized protein (TIGR00730 family)
MRELARVAVFCGSSSSVSDVYLSAARAFGHHLAERGTGLVFGAGSVGMMGAVADAVLEAGGEAIGVIPQKLVDLELAYEGLTEIRIVKGMHARKAEMASLADAFVALPGGYGTLDELFEAATWTQLNYHHKPVGLLDVDGYFAALVAFIDHATTEGFVKPLHRRIIAVDDDPGALLNRLAGLRVPLLSEWIDDV